MNQKIVLGAQQPETSNVSISLLLENFTFGEITARITGSFKILSLIICYFFYINNLTFGKQYLLVFIKFFSGFKAV